jgi:hypothetical protein
LVQVRFKSWILVNTTLNLKSYRISWPDERLSASQECISYMFVISLLVMSNVDKLSKRNHQSYGVSTVYRTLLVGISVVTS